MIERPGKILEHLLDLSIHPRIFTLVRGNNELVLSKDTAEPRLLKADLTLGFHLFPPETRYNDRQCVLQLDYDTSQRIHLHATAISFPILFWLKMRLPTAGGAPIRVVQATQDRDRAQRSGTARRLLWGRLRERLPEALMRPRPVAVRHVRAEHAGPLPLAADEHVVEARAADAPQEALVISDREVAHRHF